MNENLSSVSLFSINTALNKLFKFWKQQEMNENLSSVSLFSINTALNKLLKFWKHVLKTDLKMVM